MRYHSPKGLTAPISRAFALLAWEGHTGHTDEAAAQKAYSEGWNALFKHVPPPAMPGRKATTLQSFEEGSV